MGETRKIAAILVSDVVGYSRLTGVDEDRALARLRAVRSDLIDPLHVVHHGRVVKRTGDGAIVEFRSVVDAVRCAIEVQQGMIERNAGVPPEKRIEFRIGIHLGDVVEESDGDLMGDGVNIAARLEGVAQPGAICLSEQAYWQVKGRLDLKVTDLGAIQLKNIAEPIHVYSLEVGKPAQAKHTPVPAPEKPAPPRLSLVVLPFANIGGDPEQEYFADGVTESLTTDLSRISGSFVIGRHTAFTFKGKPVDIKKLGRELNVRYVLEGSVQRGGNRLRVNVQLIAAETGNHLWAERFEKPVADLFDMLDEIVSRLANTLNSELFAVEARRAERSPHPDATDLCFQGAAWLNMGRAPENMAQARGFYERALALEPANVEALVGTAWANFSIGTNLLPDDRIERLTAAEAAVTKALSLAPNHPMAHNVLGNVQIFTNRAAQGIAECERSLALDRNLARAQSNIGTAKLFLGRGGETEAHVEQALRLSPRDTNVYIWSFFVGLAKFWQGADAEAMVWLRRSLEANRNYPSAHFYLAAVLAYVGELDEARATAQAGLALNPNFSIRRYRTNTPSNHPVYLAGRERLIEGLRLAGVPEA